jgi:hypothetical protein
MPVFIGTKRISSHQGAENATKNHVLLPDFINPPSMGQIQKIREASQVKNIRIPMGK